MLAGAEYLGTDLLLLSDAMDSAHLARLAMALASSANTSRLSLRPTSWYAKSTCPIWMSV